MISPAASITPARGLREHQTGGRGNHVFSWPLRCGFTPGPACAGLGGLLEQCGCHESNVPKRRVAVYGTRNFLKPIY